MEVAPAVTALVTIMFPLISIRHSGTDEAAKVTVLYRAFVPFIKTLAKDGDTKEMS